MKPVINVEKNGAGAFIVTITEKGSQSRHEVTVQNDYYQKLTRSVITEANLVERSFRFLLEREPKESILPRFDLQVIRRYFPDFDAHMQGEIAAVD